MNVPALIMSVALLCNLDVPAIFVPQIPLVTPHDTGTNLRIRDLNSSAYCERLGDAAYANGDLKTAELMYFRAKVVALLHAQSAGMAACTGKLAVVLAEEGKLVESRQTSMEALRYYRRLPYVDINLGATMHNLAWVSEKLGMRKDARQWYIAAMRSYTLLDTDLSRALAAMSERQLAKMYLDQGDLRLATNHYRSCVRTLEKCLRPDSSTLLVVRAEYIAAKQLLTHRRNRRNH